MLLYTMSINNNTYHNKINNILDIAYRKDTHTHRESLRDSLYMPSVNKYQSNYHIVYMGYAVMNRLRLIYLELKGYIRLKPNGVTRFRLDIDNPYQIIIGSNGSGKSSIMKELTPLPGNHKQFTRNGYKIIFLEYNGTFYKLTNDFNTKLSNFQRTDPTGETVLEELNPSGNVTTQRKLAYDIFKYDAEIAAVITHENDDYKFTKMNKHKRREWMLRLGNIGLDYAIKLHKAVKSEANAQSSVIKHLKKRIGDESSKKMSDDEVAELERKSNLLTTEITELMSATIPNTESKRVLLDRIKGNISRLDSVTQQVFKRRPVDRMINPFGSSETPESFLISMRYRLVDLKDRKIAATERTNKLYNDYTRISDLIRALHDNAAKSVQDLKNEYDEKDRTITELDTQLFIRHTNDHVELALGTRDEFRTEFESIVDGLEDNPNDHLNQVQYKQNQANIQKYRDSLILLTNRLSQLEHQMEHMVDQGLTECPKCGHKWFPMVNATMEQVRAALVDQRKRIDEHEKSIEQWQEYNLAYETRRAGLLAISALKKQIQHAPFIDYLMESEYWTRTGMWLRQAIAQWHADCSIRLRMRQISDARDLLKGAIDTAASVSPDALTSERLAEIDTEINDLLAETVTIDSRIVDYQKYLQDAGDMTQMFNTGKIVVDEIIRDMEELCAATINEQIDSTISERQINLSNITHAFNQARAVSAIIDSLSLDLIKAEERFVLLTLIERELSPTSGMIAGIISDFIQMFVEQMNSVIKQIWTSRLELLPCGFDPDDADSGELDYRFPMINALETAGDVSEGSRAQKDIVDFAFTLVVYLYLGMDNYPLYLDELGPTMDDLHRVRIGQFVKSLMENNAHSQMFMISHYISSHGIFQNADYCLLNENNIMHKPNDFNKHVILE